MIRLAWPGADSLGRHRGHRSANPDIRTTDPRYVWRCQMEYNRYLNLPRLRNQGPGRRGVWSDQKFPLRSNAVQGPYVVPWLEERNRRAVRLRNRPLPKFDDLTHHE